MFCALASRWVEIPSALPVEVVSRVEVMTYAAACSELLGIQIDAAINSGNSGGGGKIPWRLSPKSCRKKIRSPKNGNEKTIYRNFSHGVSTKIPRGYSFSFLVVSDIHFFL